MKSLNGWKRIPKEIGVPVIVTNNIDARNAHGNMSHIWLVDLVIKSSEPDKYGRFTAFDEADRRLCDLTHYFVVPLPVESSDD